MRQPSTSTKRSSKGVATARANHSGAEISLGTLMRSVRTFISLVAGQKSIYGELVLAEPLQEVLVGKADAVFKVHLRFPAQGEEAAAVHELARGAVGFG